ncbi:Pol Polyprotein [Phytophthora cinnamomi]|uniref:Pol Polyprotein n=1 Tax=Phytophthora cinnamomi TaxID=4785 RepID=UPI00355A066D|nr:Pol Polyprotein [Phytophthora cinnamomi]
MSRSTHKDDKERYLTYSITLASLKHWNAEDKFLNTTILLEGDLREAFADAAISDDDVRMDEEFTRALRKASIVVLPVDYSEKLQEELWEIRKPRTESLAEYSKRFRALVRMEHTLARLNENSPMCEDALCRLYKRGLPYDWQNKYDASGQVYTTVAALVPFFERIEQVIIHKFEVLPTLPDDMTIGRDLMGALGLVIDFKNGRITWDGSELVVRTTEHGPAAQDNANDDATLDEDDELCAGDDCATTPEDLLPQHLEAALEHCYLKLLEEYVDLYSGRLGRIRLDDYLLPLRADYTPSHARPYSVPRSQEEAAHREIQKLLEEDVIEQIYGSEAAAPAFFLVKPNGSLRLLVDFRELNKFLRRSPYYVPKIREILLRLGKAKCMSTLDANMGYFARRLARQSRAATAFCLPFGKFQFKRLPMGISTAPDEYQACMERILGDLDFVIVYLDDILIFSENPVEHLEHLRIFTWTPEDSAAFRSIKEALARSVWLAFPDYSRRFHVFADASGHQIGGVIVQGRRILACFSRSMTDTQKKYSTMEWELLSVVEILKEYRTMLLGFPVVIHTDHKNLLFPRETSLRVKRWKLLLEEYRLEVVYIPGSQNIGADAFSRLRYDFVKQVSEEELCAVEEEEVAIDGAVVKKHQLGDATCKSIIEQLEKKQADPDYALRPALGVVLLHHRSRIMVPESLRADLVEMYHSYLLHPGADKQYHTMSVFWWPGMEKDVTDFGKACNDCKRAKLHGGKQNYGHLPPTPVSNTDRPFDVVHVDLLGPISGNFYCLTAIEQQFRWLEVIIQRGKTSATTAISFERVWLCRYPRPKRVVHDLGPEFTGDEFQLLLKSMAIKDKPITAKILRRTLSLETALDYAAYAIRASYHSILRASPAQLLFGEDMLTRHLHFANWNYLSKQRFMAILQDNDRENLRRVQHFYREGDTVMLRIPARERKKTDPVAKGPFVIKTVFDNGTVLLDTGATEYRTNIRRIFPC